MGCNWRELVGCSERGVVWFLTRSADWYWLACLLGLLLWFYLGVLIGALSAKVLPRSLLVHLGRLLLVGLRMLLRISSPPNWPPPWGCSPGGSSGESSSISGIGKATVEREADGVEREVSDIPDSGGNRPP